MGGTAILPKKKRILVIFIVFLFCFSFINQVVFKNVVAQEDETPDKPKGLLQLLGKLATQLFPIIRFGAESAAAEPPVIEVSYGETVSVEVGILNLSSDDFEYFTRPFTLFEKRFLTFGVMEYPSGNEYGKWLVIFDPPVVEVKYGNTIKTNASISLRSPRLAEVPVQSGILKIRIMDTWVFGNIYFPPKGSPGDAPISRFLWFFYAITQGWGRELSGHVITDLYDVDILVKVKPYHLVKFNAVPYLVFRPDEIVSIPITLQNLGNYNDTFSFRVASEHNDIKIAEPMSITLAPGEVRDAYLGVSIPPSLFDYGTRHEIKIEAYSIYQENVTIAERTVALESKGVYFSEISGIGIFFLIFILIILIIFILFRRKRLMESVCVKPDKPWEIPEEEKYLERLKKRDKQKYSEVLKMMQDEYQSALLWYDSYIKSFIQQKQVKKDKIKKEKSRKKEKILLKKEEKPKVEEKKEKKPVEKKEEDIKIIEEPIKKKEKIIVDKKIRAEQLKKEQILLKIKRDQEKQRRKLTKSSS